jgi:mRNA interferase RelE/StbE
VGSYSVRIVRSAEKEIAGLTARLRRLVIARIQVLAHDPRPPGCQKLTGEEKHRIRQGDWRVVYVIEDAIVTVTVVRVAHHSWSDSRRNPSSLR